MRRSAALFVILALFLALFRAPFFHLHAGHEHTPDEPGHDLLHLAFHTHVESHTSSADHDGETSVGVQRANGDAQSVDVLLFLQETPPSLPVQVEQVAFCSRLIPTGLTIYELTPRTHDPPWIHSSIPRSPPA
jgi:hypothetical protein